jgi:hypothetical protein
MNAEETVRLLDDASAGSPMSVSQSDCRPEVITRPMSPDMVHCAGLPSSFVQYRSPLFQSTHHNVQVPLLHVDTAVFPQQTPRCRGYNDRLVKSNIKSGSAANNEGWFAANVRSGGTGRQSKRYAPLSNGTSTVLVDSEAFKEDLMQEWSSPVVQKIEGSLVTLHKSRLSDVSDMTFEG